MGDAQKSSPPPHQGNQPQWMDIDDINDQPFSEDEADEVRDLDEEEQKGDYDQSDDGEDLMENMHKDYVWVDELDWYEARGIDDQD